MSDVAASAHLPEGLKPQQPDVLPSLIGGHAARRAELNGMRQRLTFVRHALAEADLRLEPLRDQHGLFSLLPLTPAQVETLRRDHAAYMAGSGRINLAGLTADTVQPFVQALGACLSGDAQ